ncbi:hypothetical protein Hlac_3364 (plasmid) [Halorubrum lacusprofundi ATCC 49239]|jgi:hypothetical protein|uniref:Uncharacterized protein n=2 Tax=Halorubrum lacusprofundi (strain ATCC 49239 / DSM 5036 / JCM 8891 / ACAM 34) TaxID=416348 RepID=B9LWP3_HALLT|nr:hypothetical protein [Halorubrum lacusprofundi]ACM58884.1 hypothetical protein Hlac_3364 [Halorubrum lacusprofundi ATCC 49239]
MSVSFTANPFSASPDFQFHSSDDVDSQPKSSAKEATHDPYHPENFDLVAFTPSPRDYDASSNFLDQNRDPRKAKGVFKSRVIKACFDGKPRLVENYNFGKPEYEQPRSAPEQLPSHLVMMVNEIADADTFFGLLLDPLNKTVVSGHVLQVSVVQATQVTEEGRSLRLWNQSEIDRMTSIVKEHEGRVRNAFIDPYEGQSDHWVDDRDYDHPSLRFDLPKSIENQL